MVEDDPVVATSEPPSPVNAELVAETPRRNLLLLLPFLVKGSLALIVFRGLRERGYDVTLGYCTDASSIYTPDPAGDFRNAGRLIDLTQVSPGSHLTVLEREIDARDIGLIAQVGAATLYRHFAHLRQTRPELRIVDILYNEIGHVVNHFLFERSMDGVIVESDYMRRYLERNTEKANPNVMLAESGIDVVDFTVPEKVRNPADGFVVGYVGRMSQEKNPLGFVDICEALSLRSLDLRFRMFGEGPMAAAVRARAEASMSALQYMGYVDHVRSALHQIDALIVPSTLDGRPNIIMEANACGVPVIGSPVGGIPELIVEGENGHVIDPKNINKMAEVLGAWLSDPAHFARMRQQARQMAERKFDRRFMLDAYAGAVEHFLGIPSAPAYGPPESGLSRSLRRS